MAIMLGLGPSGEAPQLVALEWVGGGRNFSQHPGRLSTGLNSTPVGLEVMSLCLDGF